MKGNDYGKMRKCVIQHPAFSPFFHNVFKCLFLRVVKTLGTGLTLNNRLHVILFSYGAIVYPNTYGSGSGPILIDDLNCDGSEQDISQCNSRTWGTSNCGHGQDLAIDCGSLFVFLSVFLSV